MGENFLKITTNYELPTAPVINQGTFDEMLNMNNTFDSLIMKKSNNIAEGFVFKCVIEPEYKIKENSARLIIKSKTDKFSEIVANSGKQKARKQANSKKGFNLNALIDALDEINKAQYNEVMALVNENRLDAVLSKMTDKQKNFKRIVSAMYDDVVTDFGKSLNAEVVKLVNKAVEDLVKKNMGRIMRNKI